MTLETHLDSRIETGIVQRVGDTTWRLGLEGEGKYRDFDGPVADIWPKLCDTYVQWCNEDNEHWLAEVKRKAARLPDTIQVYPSIC